MAELIEKIIGFFQDKAVSLSRKMTILLFVCVTVLLVDNYCGFSYFFVQSYKLNYITSLEDARQKYAKDEVVSHELDRMMVNAINRWTIFSAVSDIFQNTSSTTSVAREQKLAEELAKDKNKKAVKEIKTKDEIPDGFFSQLFPVAERSPFWHTVCTCLNLVFILLICIIYLIFSPFTHDSNKKNALLGMCFVIPFLIVVIFFIQWILSFIPDIDGRPRINYIIYVLLNVLILVLVVNKNVKN